MKSTALDSNKMSARVHSRRHWGLFYFSATVVFLALLSAALIGVGGLIPLATLYGSALVMGAIALGVVRASQLRLTRIFATVLLLTIIQSPIHQITGVPIGYVFELICFSLLLGAVIAAYRSHAHSPIFRALALLVLLYFALALLSSALGRSKPMAAFWQLQYNLKLPAMLLIGMMMAFEYDQELWLKRFLSWAWIPIAIFVAIEALAPSVYGTVLRLPLDHTVNPLLGVGMRRAGPFQHSGLLAITVALMCWCCLLYGWMRKEKRWIVFGVVYAVLLLLAGQRQETLALVLVLVFWLTYLVRRQWRPLLVASTLLIALLAVGATVLELNVVQSIERKWGGGTGLDLVSERNELTRAGVSIAKHWFPLGSGLGTYGSAGAQKFDLTQFVDYGFEKHWWFQRGLFLIDVYWPSVAAEAGFPGALLWLIALLLLLAVLLRSAWRSGRADILPWIASGAMLLLLANSPTSAVLTDPRTTFWMWLLIGAAVARAMNGQGSAKTPS